MKLVPASIAACQRRPKLIALVVCCVILPVGQSKGQSLAWIRQFGSASGEFHLDVAMDAAGNAYLSGGTEGSFGGPNEGSYDAFLTKFDAIGTLQWSRQVGTASDELSYAVEVDAAGNAYVSGWTFGSLFGPNPGGTDAFLAKYDSFGSLQWSRQIGGAELYYSYGLAVDPAGNSYISGWTQYFGVFDTFLMKFNSLGTLQWSRQFGTASDDYSYAVAVDTAGNAYVSGWTTGNLSGPNQGGVDAFLTKFDATGTLLWSRQVGTAGDDDFYGVAVDGAGNAYLSGSTKGSLGGPNAGGYDAFLTKVEPQGAVQWSRQIGTVTYDFGTGVAVDKAGNAYLSGFTNGSLGGPNQGITDVFLARFEVPEPTPPALLYLACVPLLRLLRRRPTTPHLAETTPLIER